MSVRNVVLGLTLLLLIASLAPPAHAADIYACKDAHGHMTYQDTPCPQQSKTVGHNTYTPVPDAPYSSPYARADAQPAAGSQRQTTTNVSGYSQAVLDAQPAGCAGIGCSEHQSGQTRATQCTAPNGRAYYTTDTCTSRAQYVGTTSRDWRHDTVEGHPDAVMINRDEALDPRTGHIIQLDAAPLNTPVYQTVRDAGRRIDSDAACAAARQDAHMHPRDAKAAKRAHEVCSAGRGLWDQAPPDRGIQ